MTLLALAIKGDTGQLVLRAQWLFGQVALLVVQVLQEAQGRVGLLVLVV
ncbi:MAG: hypothetical protein CM15mP45_16360 [Deltaproteobacteria bacterium]|nr:MAG: hypothetical protein CM15mP45_16360 [Deltaproteobacteria bacterium]